MTTAADIQAKATPANARLTLALATPVSREAIYRIRHEVYALELGQHSPESDRRLTDPLDEFNTYIVAVVEDRVVGFVSITPPGAAYSLDKYFDRRKLPFPIDDVLYEVRLLTVVPGSRDRGIGPLLMYAAFRWIEEQGGRAVAALGRREVLGLYQKAGLQPTGEEVTAGAVQYRLLYGAMERLRSRLSGRWKLLERLLVGIDWDLPLPLEKEEVCYHGGDSFRAIGDEFRELDRRAKVINADVLDAWFPPSPRVLRALHEHLEWLVRTSPPTGSEGLERTIARRRSVEPDCILAGGGSSDLIFLALTQWLSPASRVMILDPMYGEYAHVLTKVVGCMVDRFRLPSSTGFRLDADRWAEAVERGDYDLAIVVNPNSPTGQHVGRREFEDVLERISTRTRVWVDETYVDYVGPGASLERWAAGSDSVVVCKSMSKAYALSGMRVGYLCASPGTIRQLRPFSPPWAVGLPAQVAAVGALDDPEYYAERWEETHRLRERLACGLERELSIDVLPGVANFLLCRFPVEGPDASAIGAAARVRGLYLRDVGNMGSGLGSHAFRIAVKDSETNGTMIAILREIMS